MAHRSYHYRYHQGEIEARVFLSDAIPLGWVDSPALCRSPADADLSSHDATRSRDDKSALVADLKLRGISCDRRWSLARLRAALEQGQARVLFACHEETD